VYGERRTSLASTKLNGSMGFQHTLLDFIANTNLRIGTDIRRSYKLTPRSAHVEASRDFSAGLNLTESSVSVPHLYECTGSGRFQSHTSRRSPHVASCHAGSGLKQNETRETECGGMCAHLLVDPVVVDAGQGVRGRVRAQRFHRVRVEGLERPLLDGLVIAAGEERGTGGVRRHAAHEALVGDRRPETHPTRQVPHLEFPVARARDERHVLVADRARAENPVRMPIQRTNERFRENLVEFRRHDGLLVLPCALKRVQRRVTVPVDLHDVKL